MSVDRNGGQNAEIDGRRSRVAHMIMAWNPNLICLYSEYGSEYSPVMQRCTRYQKTCIPVGEERVVVDARGTYHADGEDIGSLRERCISHVYLWRTHRV